MPADEREWWRSPPPRPDELERPRREGYGPNVRWRSLTAEESVAVWRLVTGVTAFFFIVGKLFG